MRRSTSALALSLCALAACGDAPPHAEAAAPPREVVPEAAAPDSPVPNGYYECYFYGDYGLQNSSLVSLTVLPGLAYEALEARGQYAVEGNTVRMQTGPLAGRVAELGESDGRPALIFRRRPNEVNGRPTLDVSDTWCYHRPR